MEQAKQVKCSKCGYISSVSEFKMGRDFFQNPYIAGCPKCKNWQAPGDASMRAFGGERPFIFVDWQEPKNADVVATVMHRAEEAS